MRIWVNSAPKKNNPKNNAQKKKTQYQYALGNRPILLIRGIPSWGSYAGSIVYPGGLWL
jgi:hypothetical protein